MRTHPPDDHTADACRRPGAAAGAEPAGPLGWSRPIAPARTPAGGPRAATVIAGGVRRRPGNRTAPAFPERAA
ncbi:hypothetical protein ABT354_18295 [Streptomyces sp. NPDC000594]|uniref:hypothetical protein n=1 Tax=Streptomyces sp. NPDC000594 TaxID=3154261 RepID=UPI00332B4725